MSVLIKGIKMPDSCGNCEWRRSGVISVHCSCDIIHELIIPYEYRARWEKCPLVEIPTPHGDLVDAQEILSGMNNSDYSTYNDYCTAFDAVDGADIVVEAEP